MTSSRLSRGVQGPVPETRRFAYPFLRFESLEDDWDASVNLNFVALTEDVYLGRRWGVTLGLAPGALARDGDRARLVLEVQTLRARGSLAGARGPNFEGWWRFADDEAENWVAWGSSSLLPAKLRLCLLCQRRWAVDRGLTGERQVLLGMAARDFPRAAGRGPAPSPAP